MVGSALIHLTSLSEDLELSRWSPFLEAAHRPLQVAPWEDKRTGTREMWSRVPRRAPSFEWAGGMTVPLHQALLLRTVSPFTL